MIDVRTIYYKCFISVQLIYDVRKVKKTYVKYFFMIIFHSAQGQL